nr:MAG: hypothetical protein EDM05_08430 [Leptolyngbya sp. IPPAS B-1204]
MTLKILDRLKMLSYPNLAVFFLFPHPSDAAITWAKQQAPFQIKEVSLMPTSETKLLSLELP